jgi:hypothetical protein
MRNRPVALTRATAPDYADLERNRKRAHQPRIQVSPKNQSGELGEYSCGTKIGGIRAGFNHMEKI